MKQHLRSLWTLLLLMMWCSVGFAQTTVTFDATKDKSSTTTLTKDGVTLNINNGTFSNGTDYRSYKNATRFTVSSAKGKITKIELTCKGSGAEEYGPGILTGANVGKYTYKGTIGTWIGNAQSVTINKKNTAQVRMEKIVVTLEAEKTKTTLTFPEQTISINGGDEASFKGQPAKLYAGEQELTGKTIKYAHKGNEIFATFDGTTGAATLKSGVYGTATVTATYAGDDTYEEAVASYTVKIVDPNASEATFDFSKPKDYGCEVPTSSKAPTKLKEGDKLESGIITITNIYNPKTTSSTNDARFHYNSNDGITFRVYKNGIISLSAQTGYTITKFTFEATEGGNLTTSSGTYNSQTKTWEGNAQSLSLTFNAKTFFQKLTVTYSKVATTTSLPLNETTTAEDAKTLLGANLNKTVNVTINRTLVANKWNTLCLPFDVTAEQIKNILKAEGMVREYKDQTADCINFQAAETMTAGVPYLIKPTEEVKGLTFEGVKITAVEGKTKGGIGSENLAISGILGARKLESFELFLNADGKFVAPAKGKETMKGFRAYFISLLGAGAKINIDGETTGINNIETEATVNGKVYNLNGQYVGNSLNGLKKGIYVVNGKKVIK